MKRREPYAKLYASWWRHTRTGPLSLAAGGLEARMLSWSSDQGSDGRVPVDSLDIVARAGKERDRALAELIARGVVTRDGNDLVVRDYLDANISKERDEERRAGAVTRQHRSREPKSISVTRDRDAKRESVTRDKNACHAPSLDHDHDHDHDHHDRKGDPEPVAPARPSPAAPPRPPARMDVTAFSRDTEVIRSTAEQAFRAADVAAPRSVRDIDGKPWTALVEPLRDVASSTGETVAKVAERLMAGFLASERARAKGFPIGFLVANPNEYLSARVEPAVDVAAVMARVPKRSGDVHDVPEDWNPAKAFGAME